MEMSNLITSISLEDKQVLHLNRLFMVLQLIMVINRITDFLSTQQNSMTVRVGFGPLKTKQLPKAQLWFL